MAEANDTNNTQTEINALQEQEKQLDAIVKGDDYDPDGEHKGTLDELKGVQQKLGALQAQQQQAEAQAAAEAQEKEYSEAWNTAWATASAKHNFTDEDAPLVLETAKALAEKYPSRKPPQEHLLSFMEGVATKTAARKAAGETAAAAGNGGAGKPEGDASPDPDSMGSGASPKSDGATSDFEKNLGEVLPFRPEHMFAFGKQSKAMEMWTDENNAADLAEAIAQQYHKSGDAEKYDKRLPEHS